MLYEYNYDIVLQDAETMLEYFERTDSFTMSDMLRPLRRRKIRAQEENIPNAIFTKEEQMLPPGSILEKNGQVYIVPGQTGDKMTFIILSSYDVGWEL